MVIRYEKRDGVAYITLDNPEPMCAAADFFSEIVFCTSRRLSTYCAIKPPSITNSVPVMNEASSEARNSTP